MEIMDMNLPVYGAPVELIRSSMTIAALHPVSCQTKHITMRMMFASVGALAGGSAAEFTAPDDQSLFKQTPLFQFLNQAGNRAVRCTSILPTSGAIRQSV